MTTIEQAVLTIDEQLGFDKRGGIQCEGYSCLYCPVETDCAKLDDTTLTERLSLLAKLKPQLIIRI